MGTKIVDGVEMPTTAEDDAQAAADAAAFAAAQAAIRRTLPKLLIQSRVKALGKIDAVWARLQAAPDAFGRWILDGPSVYADDPELIGLLTVSGLSADEIATVTAPA